MKSGKKTWDSRKARTGSMETFFMGDDGFATFEDESEAEEHRNWETRNRRRRRKSRVTIHPTPKSTRSRRGTRTAADEDEFATVLANEGAIDDALAHFNLQDVMNEAKAETVAAILAVEAMDFSGEDEDRNGGGWEGEHTTSPSRGHNQQQTH